MVLHVLVHVVILVRAADDALKVAQENGLLKQTVAVEMVALQIRINAMVVKQFVRLAVVVHVCPHVKVSAIIHA